MYCPTCGTVSTPGLSYCNRCGTNLGTGKDQGAGKSPESPVNALMDSIFWVTVFGLGAIVGGVVAMKALELRDVYIISYMILSTLAFIGIYGLHVWQFIRLTKSEKTSGSTAMKGPDTKELAPAEARLLSEPVPSVTEYTTRTFDPIYTERKAEYRLRRQVSQPQPSNSFKSTREIDSHSQE